MPSSPVVPSPILTRRTLAAGLSLAWATSTTASPPAPAKITLLGDSITAGLGLPAAAALPMQLQLALARLGAPAVVRGAGVSGDTSADGLARVDFSVQPDTMVCVVELGANDYLQSVDPRETDRDLTRIVQRLKVRGITVVLVSGTAPPHSSGGYGREFNAIFPRLAMRERVVLAPDLLAGVTGQPALRQADGLHPNAAGVRVIAARLAPAVLRAIQVSRRPRGNARRP